jgi:hypothetical protein
MGILSPKSKIQVQYKQDRCTGLVKSVRVKSVRVKSVRVKSVRVKSVQVKVSYSHTPP